MHSQRLADLDKGRVAGVYIGIQQCLDSVTGGIVAAERSVRHLHTAGAGEGGVHVNHPFFQGGRTGKDFKHRTGLVGPASAFIVPLLIQQIRIGVGGGASFADRLVQLGLLGGGVQRKGIVGIVIRVTGHRQDLSVIHVHHNGAGAPRRIAVRHCLIQRFFYVVLNLAVDGKHQALAVHRSILRFIGGGDGIAVGIRRTNDLAGGAGQDVVVLQLNAA